MMTTTAAVEAAREYAENIVETVREPLLVLDADLKILSANGRFFSTFKVTPEETIGNFIYDLGNKQWDIPRLRVLLEDILPKNTVFNDYEVDHDFQNIGRKTILLNARQIFRKDIGSHIILLAMEDITECMQLHRALKGRNKELNCLYSIISLFHFPDASLDAILARAVLLIPPALQFPEITEARIEIEGKSFHTARYRETPWMLGRDIDVNGTHFGRITVCCLEERQSHGGRTFLIDEQYLLTILAEKLSALIEKFQADTELQKSIDRFDQLAEQSGTVVWEVDAGGLYTYISHVSETVLGYRPDEIIGRVHFFDLHPESGREEFRKAALAVFERKESFHNLENSIRARDGHIVWVSTCGVPILSAEGALLGYRGSDTDITEMKSIMAQLIHSQKMESIGALAGGLAHDLNNILCVVNGYTTLAQFEMNKDQLVFTYLEEITRASSRAASLTRSLLAYSRKQEMNQQNNNLNPLIETIGSFISRIIHDNIRFSLSLQDDPLAVYVDTVQIEQVLLNLATNARDAMPNGGTFTISTATGSIDAHFIASRGYGTVGQYAIITVTDSGHGMDEQTKRKVFDPFFTTKEVGKGTGLGLSMAMGIISQHGGFIDLQSEAGNGTVFQIFLPLAGMEEGVSTPVAEHFQITHASGTILVAEDDADTRNSLNEFLTRVGYTVITAVDGQNAVEKFAARKDEIDLVISDVVMPRKSGKTASDEMRKMSKKVKFIFVSGHTNDVIEREGGFCAEVEILTKPILPYELLRKIHDTIGDSLHV